MILCAQGSRLGTAQLRVGFGVRPPHESLTNSYWFK
jgi:hypothetical protein